MADNITDHEHNVEFLDEAIKVLSENLTDLKGALKILESNPNGDISKFKIDGPLDRVSDSESQERQKVTVEYLKIKIEKADEALQILKQKKGLKDAK